MAAAQQHGPAQAREVFAAQFRAVVEELYAATERSYPACAQGADWREFRKRLQASSQSIEEALAAEKTAIALSGMAYVRQLFFHLRADCDALASNDYIYAFRTMTYAEQPQAAAMLRARKAVSAAPPSRKASAQAERYQQALNGWAQVVDKALSDRQLTDEEMPSLREATEALFAQYGVHLH